ncbi:ATP-binding cassette, subfamily B [Amphibacillus marinus]|uniref:ATP-binding cassette, subfamily B n=1 Tax=Amphibacillus marinus TaxID=872970 RepID=A0A1H8NC49_9BACI|nr:ABC transporter ATP-binding protein [Amphibacillus marinus]SEO27170.1 ATP-binding cassette, subfamily B [Amphibacillus marinus]
MAKHRPQQLQQTTRTQIKKPWPTIKRLWRYLSVRKASIYLVLLAVLVSSLLTLLGPYYLGYAVDHYLIEADQAGLFRLLLLLAVIYLLTSVALWLQNFIMIKIAQQTIFSMRNQLFSKLHQLSIRFFDERQDGDMMSRLTNDLENVSQTLNSSVIQVFSSGLTLIGTIILMLYLSPLLTVITLMILPILYFGMNWITKRTRLLFKEQQKHLGELNGFIEETISGQSVVKIFSQEETVLRTFAQKNHALREAGYLAQAYSGFIPKLMNMLNNLGFAIIAFSGGILAIYQLVSIGIIVTFTQYSRQFTRPLNDLANQFNTLLSAVAGAERVFEILDQPIEQEQAGQPLGSIKGDITFNQVSFSYQDSQTISNISFYAKAGQTIALVGPTGAGKTTIINLLSRFYDPDQGTIMIDSHDITNVSRASLRTKMGFVLQDPFLFSGSIKANIRYGRLEATDQDIVEAAKQANADRFISALPQGYDTELSADGNGISQGQKQLLSIARAILANPDILILDEATSSIDTVTEIKIQSALHRLMDGRTSVVIAHRLNTIQQADHIFVLNEGAIIEDGTHEELLSQHGFYYELYNEHFEERIG